jgi:hypothetical protein
MKVVTDSMLTVSSAYKKEENPFFCEGWLGPPTTEVWKGLEWRRSKEGLWLSIPQARFAS